MEEKQISISDADLLKWIISCSNNKYDCKKEVIESFTINLKQCHKSLDKCIEESTKYLKKPLYKCNYDFVKACEGNKLESLIKWKINGYVYKR